jgi:hypothetical protein
MDIVVILKTYALIFSKFIVNIKVAANPCTIPAHPHNNS